MTVITFFIDTSKFRYPQRPIIFLSLCYAMYSVGYLVRLISGREQVICDSDRLLTSGLDNTNCAAIFLLLYYFSMAASLWWVVLSLTWLLSAGLKWSHDAIELYSSYFHLVAWAVPAIQSIAIIILREVSSEELTGICFVGYTSKHSLLGFVIGPMATYLLLGTGLLVTGFIFLFCNDKHDSMKGDEKIETLVVRIGIFSVLYTVPTTALIACYFYEYINSSTWDEITGSPPSMEIYMLKIFSCLLPGITSGVCILSGKTIDTWSLLCTRLCNRKPVSKNNNIKMSPTRQYVPVKQITGRHATSPSSSTGPPSHNSSRIYDKYSRKPPHAVRVYASEYHV